MTEYVSTRWYRAPEVLLRTRDYNAPVDMFACGCIMAELYMLRPLFPGKSESDMINRVCQIMGSPTSAIWAAGMEFAATRRVKFPTCPKTPLSKLMPHANAAALDLMDALMLWDPAKRPTCNQSLQHEYFQLQPGQPSGQQSAPHTSRGSELPENVQPNRSNQAKLEKSEKRERRDKDKALPHTHQHNQSPSAHSSMPDLSPHSKQTSKLSHIGSLLSEPADEAAVKKARARKPGRRDPDTLTQVSSDRSEVGTNTSNLNASNSNRRASVLDSNISQKAALKLPDLDPTDSDFGLHPSLDLPICVFVCVYIYK